MARVFSLSTGSSHVAANESRVNAIKHGVFSSNIVGSYRSLERLVRSLPTPSRNLARFTFSTLGSTRKRP